MTTIYLASPTGFTPEHATYRARVKVKLISQGHVVIDPWEWDYSDLFRRTATIPEYEARIARYNEIRRVIGAQNRADIMRADVVLGILDGTEPYSGTVAEVCYAAGKGKVAFGLRTDFRDCGDLPGVALNLQVLDFIEVSGGKLFRSIDEVVIP